MTWVLTFLDDTSVPEKGLYAEWGPFLFMRRIRGDAMSAIWAILGKGIAIAIAGGGAFMIADYTLGWM